MRVLAIDIGTVRIGLAISDPTGTVATPVETVQARPRDAAVARIVDVVADRGVEQIVVGLPRELSGREGHAVRRTRAFVDLLAHRTDVPIDEWDERMTSAMAERSLVAGDVRRARRKEVIDQVAAALLLQSWLDARGRS